MERESFWRRWSQIRIRQFSFTFIYPLTAGVVGNQFRPFISVLHCRLGLGKLHACPFPEVFPPLLLSASSSFPLSLCLAIWFWPDLTNGRHVHTTPVCVSLRWSGSTSGPIACWILAQTSSLTSQLVSWCFKPSQPQRITSGLRETFIKRYLVERTNRAELRPGEQTEKAGSDREKLRNEIQLKGL